MHTINTNHFVGELSRAKCRSSPTQVPWAHNVGIARLNEVELFVADIIAALRIYRDEIGVPLKGHRHADGEPVHYHATWGSGAAFLLFSVYESTPGQETRASFSFAVTDLDTLHATMQAAGLRVVQDIQMRPWGSRTALYSDATSNRIWLSESANREP